MVFENRTEAGKLLAEELSIYRGSDAIVVALPRGGVPVGFEISRSLQIPLAVMAVRKIGAPSNPEFAIGAIAPGDVTLIDKITSQLTEISDESFEHRIQEEKKKLKRREKLYGFPPLLSKKIIILIDDGIATGLTMKAAIMAIKKQTPEKIILAVPCAPIEITEELEIYVDSVICLEKRKDFSSVGACYRDFDQVTDEEVLDLLVRSKT